jgi:hypothetical protein
MALFGWLSRKASWISDAEFELERIKKLIESPDYKEKFIPQFRIGYGLIANAFSRLQASGQADREKIEKLATAAKGRVKTAGKGDKTSEDAHGLAANWAMLKLARTKYDNFIIEQFGTLHPPTHDPLFD